MKLHDWMFMIAIAIYIISISNISKTILSAKTIIMINNQVRLDPVESMYYFKNLWKWWIWSQINCFRT